MSLTVETLRKALEIYTTSDSVNGGRALKVDITAITPDTVIATGADTDGSSISSNKPVLVGGRAENVASLPTFSVGQAVNDRHDKDTGAKVVLQGNLDKTIDSVTSFGSPSTIKPALVVSTSPAYSANDNIGGKQTLTGVTSTSGGSAYLDSIDIQVLEAVSASFDIWIFNSDPTAGTYTDNSAMVVGTTDILKVIAVISVTTADYKSCGTVQAANIQVKKLLTASGSTNLYAAYKVTNTPTFAATGNLQIAFNFDRVN